MSLRFLSVFVLSLCFASPSGSEPVTSKFLSDSTPLSEEERKAFEERENSLSATPSDGFSDRANALLAAVWKYKSIPVCWETMADETSWFRDIVRQATRDSWERHSGLTLTGWKKCVSGNRGIRIKIKDVNPQVLKLGDRIDGVPGGVILNATYKNYSPNCQGMLTYCSYGIAVHEFGHALGFAHEQNRHDTPEHCKDKKQGENGSSTLNTDWDEGSVMNYCNPLWTSGRLSKWDVFAVQKLYGKP